MPESWTALCQKIRSFQCRCSWEVSPCDATLSNVRNTMWKVAPPLDAKHNPDFNSLCICYKDRFVLGSFSRQPSTDNKLQTKSRKHSTEQKGFGSAFSLYHLLFVTVLSCRICVSAVLPIVKVASFVGTNSTADHTQS